MGRKEGGQPGNKNAEKWTEEKALAVIEEMFEWMMEDEDRIFYEGFFHQKDGKYRYTTLHYLKNKFESFSILLKEVEELQRFRLMEGSSKGTLVQAPAIFLMKSVHKMYDKDVVEHQGTDGSPLTFNVNFVKDKGNDYET